ncbi:hypothetical protein [Steroidobacter sp.]|uniref:hypothetical protein n=1 Tax=Steroidobacter sp. TaxID=1978227 RepID=UPI001A48604B|nr:hypothetical protein [Steroidobacter sp.]MBL8267752.1 hypothetical protein [Steroidobacter sp.]
MERGVVVGGLMICGSFLLAAMLNRSAMEELPATALPVPTEVLPTPVIVPEAAPGLAGCGEVESSGNSGDDASHAVAQTEQTAAGLMVNGPETCPR